MTPESINPKKNGADVGSLAEELKQECERLRQLAEKLQARERALADMESTYPHLLKYAYAKLREDFHVQEEDLSDKDLETLAIEKGALPLEAFIGEIEKITEGS